jgi:hypothetical protein
MLVAGEPDVRASEPPGQAQGTLPAQGCRPAFAEMRPVLEASIQRVERWVEDHDYKGYEPFDGLSSSLRPWTCGNLFLERLLLQLIRQSPLNLRPVLGVTPLDSTKGRGYMASGYLTMLQVTADGRYAERAVSCLEWLIRHKSSRFRNFTWANHFDFASRGGRYSKDEPIVVWTALIGQAFLDAFECLNEPRYLEVAESICDWILALPRERTGSGTCISYHALFQSSVHNANMLGAAILARTARLTGNARALDVATEAMEYSCSRQRPDGSWYYAEDPRFRWIDNFHTAYNLDSLKCYIDNSDDGRFAGNLRHGFEFWTEAFFDAAGRPKYYHDRLYPIDSQCASQAIETLANFADYDSVSLSLGCKVATWTITHMQDPRGYFYYRRYPLLTARTPMLHWAQATTYKSLSSLLLKLTAR